jgi:hypothetical protein
MAGEADGSTAARRLELVTGASENLRAALADGDRALYTGGDLLASRESFEHAYELAERAGDPEAMAHAVLGLAGLWVSERRTLTGAVMLEERLKGVLPQLGEGAASEGRSLPGERLRQHNRSALALRVRARLAAEADYRRGGNAEILALLAEARAFGDPVVLADVLSLAHHCLLGPDDVTVRRELAMDLIRVSFRTGRRSDRLMGLMWQTVDAYSAGDPHAGRLLGELKDELIQRDHPAVGFVVSAIDVMLAIRAGRLEEAESLVGRCAKSGASAGDIDWEWWPGAQLVTIRWYQGRLPELLPMITDSVHSRALSAVDNSTVVALAVAAALDGDRPTAASFLASVCGTDLAALPRSSSWLATMNGVVETARLLADADVAARAYELLLPYADLPMVGGLGVTCCGSVWQALGVASLAFGDVDGAIGHLRAAVRHNLALGHWPAVVWSRCRLAEAHFLRGEQEDAAAAERELSAARNEAAALGLPVVGGDWSAAAAGGLAAAADGLAAAGDRPAAANGAELATCGRVGRKWRLTLGDRSVLVEDSIGMLHLAVLIANPRQDIPAADLVSGLASLGGIRDGGAAQPVLDPQAVAEYRSRVRSLDTELEAADAGGDAEQATALRAEREWLLAQLASATGLAGRQRSFPDEAERARVAAGKAIRRALARIADTDARIGEHLRQSVRTGTRCSYWPG